jgi:hypothetical protein
MFVGTQDLLFNETKAGLIYMRIIYDHNGKLDNYLKNHSIAHFMSSGSRIQFNLLPKNKSSEREVCQKQKTEEGFKTRESQRNLFKSHDSFNNRSIHGSDRVGSPSFSPSPNHFFEQTNMNRSNAFSISQSHHDNMFFNESHIQPTNLEPSYFNPIRETYGTDGYDYNYDGPYSPFLAKSNTPNIKVFKFDDRNQPLENTYNNNNDARNFYGMSSGYYIPDPTFNNKYNTLSDPYQPNYCEPQQKDRSASNSLSRKNSVGSLKDLYDLYAQEKQKLKDSKGMNQLKDFTPNYLGETLKCYPGNKSRFENDDTYQPNNTMPFGNFELRNTFNTFIHFKPESTEIFKYDFIERKWSTLPNINNYKFPRYFAIAEVSDSNLVLTGGEFEESTLISAVYYSDEMFIELADMNTPRKGHSSIFYDGYVYVFGGFLDDKTIIRECERYNFKTKEWEDISNMIFTKAYATPVLVNGSIIYLIGGFSSGKFEGVRFFNFSFMSLIKLRNMTLRMAFLNCLRLSYRFVYSDMGLYKLKIIKF